MFLPKYKLVYDQNNNFGIGNWNLYQVSVSVLLPKLSLPDCMYF